MNTSVYFLLTSLCNSSIALAAKGGPPVVIPAGETSQGAAYVTFQDVESMKVWLLTFILTGAAKIAWDIWQKVQDKTKDKLETLDSDLQEVLKALHRLEIHVSNLQNNQVTHERVSDLVKKELEYVERLRRRE